MHPQITVDTARRLSHLDVDEVAGCGRAGPVMLSAVGA